eukprot:CAMPEP_0116868812 /NCGR_PEP_ID=MMETSP0418-20121206/27409_1 /TAXON_ID=1158023 /ORGANISM="Astrosyne radiata, Strain 13vi08-1A" /LENGTH=387 /DNA_ID=CAMNT_0004504833 /DNA_START=274 /DNA_END=1437 /DNA_ORIENTATION=+
MTNVPISCCAQISRETGRHLPIFTVVTELGSAHSLWFCDGVEKLFVGSPQVYRIAQNRGKVSEDRMVLAGLPIRHDFVVQGELLGDRSSPEGKAYQRKVREELGLPHPERNFLLVMGGGEGVGSLSKIVDSLYTRLIAAGIDAVIVVVCGRNETLRKSLKQRDWDTLLQTQHSLSESNNSTSSFSNGAATTPKQHGKVHVVTLGFVTQMAEYMVAADVLVSKAGPGTMTEAASLSLPILLTNYLPGQEEGNIDYVIQGGFGNYHSDEDPTGIADELVGWLRDEEKMKAFRRAARQRGTLHAARDIAKTIGDSASRWREINRANDKAKQLVATTTTTNQSLASSFRIMPLFLDSWWITIALAMVVAFVCLFGCVRVDGMSTMIPLSPI